MNIQNCNKGDLLVGPLSSLLALASCAPTVDPMEGNRYQEVAIKAAQGQEYSYRKKLHYDVTSGKYVLTGIASVRSRLPNADPPTIYNTFKCYFSRENGKWIAEPAKENESDSTLIYGEMIINEEVHIAEIIDSQLSPFHTYAPTIEPNGKLIVDQEVEVYPPRSLH